MKIDVTRRDVLKFAGGAAVGVALSPMPWNLTDDLAIWTQNWSWIPRPPKGEETTRLTACALCPRGCAIKARCIGGLPVSLHAAVDGPDAFGALCPLGLTGHHLPYHPARLTTPVRLTRGALGARAVPVTMDAVVRETARAISAAGSGTVAVLDMRPGRSASWAWQRLLASLPNGVVVPAPAREGASLTTLSSMLGTPGAEFGLDAERALMILSFGAPIAEGWGPRTFRTRLLAAPDSRPRLVQVEPTRSRTAELADRWLPARPGTEAALALGIANVLLTESLVDAKAASGASDYAEYRSLVAGFTPDKLERLTGLSASEIVDTARELAKNSPSIVVAGEDAGGGRLGRVAETAILGLNVLLGNVDRPGGMTQRAALHSPFEGELAPIVELDRLPDRSVSVLIIDASAGDGAFPWPLVQRKLVASNSLVVALSPFLSGSAGRASMAVPTLPYLETVHEIPSPFDATISTLGLSAPILPPREGATDPVAFVRAIAGASRIALPGDWATAEALMRARVAAIHAGKEGSVTAAEDGSVKGVAELASPDELWDSLVAGGRWFAGSAPAARISKVMMRGDVADALSELATISSPATFSARNAVTLIPRASREVTATGAVSPVLTKIYRESGLRREAGVAVMNPRTAASLGVARGQEATLVTAAGRGNVRVAIDEAVMPGVVEIAVAPDNASLGDRKAIGKRSLLDICSVDERGVWRSSPAQLVEG